MERLDQKTDSLSHLPPVQVGFMMVMIELDVGAFCLVMCLKNFQEEDDVRDVKKTSVKLRKSTGESVTVYDRYIYIDVLYKGLESHILSF